jgi:sporulation protein YlmC with PRC-barrel domain
VTPIRRAISLGELGLILALTGCASTHSTAPVRQETAPAAAVAEPPPSPEQSTDRPQPDSSNAEGTAVNAVPACTCAGTKAQPKPKPKPKLVRQEAPPQLPTAPQVEQTPPGALIDAQVRSMSVSVTSILGKRVRGAKGEDLGRVVDVLADASGRVRTAIIDFGGFLGVGNHRVAVDWPLLRFNPDGRDPSLLLSLSPEKLRTAPEYKENPRPQILMVPTASAAAPAD